MQDSRQQSPPRRHFLLMDNPTKVNHLGTLLRCAAAFRAHQVLLVGHDKFNAQGSFGSHLYLDIVAFSTWESVIDYLKRGGNEHGGANNRNQAAEFSSSLHRVPIVGIVGAYGGGEKIFSPCGVSVYVDTGKGFATLSPAAKGEERNHEILPNKSFPIHTRPFSSDVCFFLSKDKRGLPSSHASMCDSFIHVPQVCFDIDSDSDAIDAQEEFPKIMQSSLLETATIYSIVLHHFTAWGNYNERNFAENQKFIKDTKSDMRRRLCRKYGEILANKDKDVDKESETEDVLIMEQSTGEFFASDY